MTKKPQKNNSLTASLDQQETKQLTEDNTAQRIDKMIGICCETTGVQGKMVIYSDASLIQRTQRWSLSLAVFLTSLGTTPRNSGFPYFFHK